MFSKSLVLTVAAITSLTTLAENAHAVPVLDPAAMSAARSNRAVVTQPAPAAPTDIGIVAPGRTQDEARRGVIPPPPTTSTDTNSKKVTVNGKDNSKVELDVTIVKNNSGDYEASYSYNPENFGARAAGCTTGDCKVSDTILIHKSEVEKLSQLNDEIVKRIGKGASSTTNTSPSNLSKEEKEARREARKVENCTLDEDAEESDVKDCVRSRYYELLDAYNDANSGKERSKAKEALLSFLDENQGRLSGWLASGGRNADFAGKLLNEMTSAKVPFNDLKVFSTQTSAQSITDLQNSYQQTVQNALSNAATNPRFAQFQMRLAENMKYQLAQMQAYGNNSFSALIQKEEIKLASSGANVESQQKSYESLSELASKFANSPIAVKPDLYQQALQSNAGCYNLRLSGNNNCKVVDMVTGQPVTVLTTQAIAENGANLGTARSDRFDGTGYAPMFTNNQIPAQFMVGSNGQLVVAGLPGANSIPQMNGANIGNNSAVIPQGFGRSGRSG